MKTQERELSSDRCARILVVDDDEGVRVVVTDVLRGLGYEVGAHVNGLKALLAFQADPEGFDAIVSDCSMPKMTGIELAKEVLKMSPKTPFILASGQHQLSAEELRRIGIREIIHKPYSVEILAEALARVLRESSHFPMAGQAMAECDAG